MDVLYFSIIFKDHIFNIRTNFLTTVCSYELEGKYKSSLTFAGKTYAHVQYQNVMFSGTVTKRNNWHIRLDMHTVIHKKNSMYYFESKKSEQNDDIGIKLEETKSDCTYNILYLYNQLTDDLRQEYSRIDNKEEFKNQLCEYLSEFYYDINNIDDTFEYENFEDVEADEEPVIEKTTIRKELLIECREFMDSFYQAEMDNKQKDSIITLENVIKETPELNQIPHSFLNEEFNKYLNVNYNDLISPDIYYYLGDVLYSVGSHILDSYRYYVFDSAVEDKIDKILSDMKIDNIDKNEIYAFCKREYNIRNIPTDKEFEEQVTEFIEKYANFLNLYDKFTSLFGSNNIKIELNDEIMQLFQKYDKKESHIDSKYFARYEVYQYMTPYYKKHIFRKNSSKYKSVVEQFPSFISYATSVIDLLFKHNILINEKETILYNEDGDIGAAYEDMEALLI